MGFGFGGERLDFEDRDCVVVLVVGLGFRIVIGIS